MTDDIEKELRATIDRQAAVIASLRFSNREMTTVEPEIISTMRDRGVHLRPGWARVLGLLMHRSGQVVPYGSLIEALSWDKNGDAPMDGIISVYVTALRDGIARAGIPGSIETVRGIGYRWIEPQQQEQTND